jgi:hypothetical protein
MKREDFLKAFSVDAKPEPGAVTATYKQADEPRPTTFAEEFGGAAERVERESSPVSVSGMAKRIAEERKAAATAAPSPTTAPRPGKGGKIHMTPDGPVIGFGAHKGKLLRDVPSDYLRWILKQDFDATVIEAVKQELHSYAR